MVRALKIDETFGMNRPLTRVYKIAPCFIELYLVSINFG